MTTSSPSPPDAVAHGEGRSRRWTVAASASAIASAIVASACCVGPLILALFGLGGGAILARFEPFRPYFVVVTFALLGAGFHLAYRRPPVAPQVVSGDACGCPAPRTRQTGRAMLWIATAMALAFVAFPYLAPLLLR
ncbi:MAG: mercury transporter MerT [Deltaproteobacteria bacterium]|nr:mercury transporter MerT [Deltaproteobacteria bacterium]